VGNLIQEVVKQENAGGDAKVGLFNVGYPADHLTGCFKHFDRVGQKQVSEEVAKALRETMGWYEGTAR
jgi:hypothetical protein